MSPKKQPPYPPHSSPHSSSGHPLFPHNTSKKIQLNSSCSSCSSSSSSPPSSPQNIPSPPHPNSTRVLKSHPLFLTSPRLASPFPSPSTFLLKESSFPTAKVLSLAKHPPGQEGRPEGGHEGGPGREVEAEDWLTGRGRHGRRKGEEWLCQGINVTPSRPLHG
ncbi:hypothetical protein E2C01_100733 [Portunus trituberculatus]|uniref:Uncharacterized protein n=1 Tax=Portunus trituberculatus TaxID=210409 RepID=A0A5B7KKB1_PORTR|nr:hypothetical protein [Portunus trituberculatus]